MHTASASPGRRIDSKKIADSLPQPMGMVPDTLLAGALALDGDEREWVPQPRGVWFKPLLLNVSHGYYVNILQVRASGVLSRHRHHGPVHAFTLRGTWRYLEHDWVASTGDYAFEPAGETHTLVIPDDAAGMTTLFHVTGSYTYIDPVELRQGNEPTMDERDDKPFSSRSLLKCYEVGVNRRTIINNLTPNYRSFLKRISRDYGTRRTSVV